MINNEFGKLKIEKLASYRTSTAPVDLTVENNLIMVADLMKSVCIVKYTEGENGEEHKLEEIGRHYQTVWSTALASVEENTVLVGEAQGNLIVLSRNLNGVTDQDKRRLIPTSEMALGEMVNKIRPIHIPQRSTLAVTPRAFLATVCASFWLLL